MLNCSLKDLATSGGVRVIATIALLTISGFISANSVQASSPTEPVELSNLDKPLDFVGNSAAASDAISVPSLYLPEPSQQISRLVLRLSERRLYAYQGDREIATYPVAVGRDDWETPVGEFTVFQLQQHPAWEHPMTGEIVPPGPDNPLGSRWIGFWTDGTNAIGFHGTPHEHLIGEAVSHGCVRLRNADVIELYERVGLGTQVVVLP
ncbi:L,D-transpeptidase [Oscillatoria sp. CS-180]|uniref:L,D-transpeptidase n=1 Tax=Oscillatoria sp. CS-180 TaxID=3021720 RepID=UPI00232DF8CA|nr:L,D-transpeptidase [Oscillatoria sp. CS-180]MDB9528879.1 L,D-transpeptidase [Oscillatoria sp. CS-180]